MTTLTEPAPRLRTLLVPFVLVGASVYLLFTALALEVYILVPIAAMVFLIGAAPAVSLIRRK